MAIAFELEDLCPEEAEFTISKTGKTYTLKPMPIGDWTYLKNKYGARLDEILKGGDWKELCNIAFRFMKAEQKAEFAPVDCVKFNEDTGEKFPARVGGGELLSTQIEDMKDAIAMLKAVVTAIGAGEPVRRAEEAAKKKKLEQQQALLASSTTDQQA